MEPVSVEQAPAPDATESGAAATGKPAANPGPAAVPAASAKEKPAYCFRDMRLKVGDRAQLDPPPQTGATRIRVTVVGWVENHSLIVTQPSTAAGRLTLERGEEVLVRAFTGHRAFAFRSTVLKRSAPPFQYLHLSFPDQVEGLEVRNSPRYRVDLPAKVTRSGGGAPLELRIDNLGTTGALLVSPEPLGATGEPLKVDFGFVLHEVPVSLSLSATIRSTLGGEDASGAAPHQHGVSFNDPSPQDRLMLRALVWYHMYETPKLAA